MKIEQLPMKNSDWEMVAIVPQDEDFTKENITFQIINRKSGIFPDLSDSDQFFVYRDGQCVVVEATCWFSETGHFSVRVTADPVEAVANAARAARIFANEECG